MQQTGQRLAIATVAVIIWAAITIGGGLWQASGDTALGALVTRQIMWGVPAAALFLLAVAWAMGWRDLGFTRPVAGWAKLMWLPLLYLVALLLLSFTKDHGLTMSIFVIILINTLLVGFSEELAFRGVLWGAARQAFSFWTGFFLVTLAFGSVHIANGLITGQYAEAGVQALNASMSGAAYLAIRIRTGSILPIMLYHGVWDLLVFINGVGADRQEHGAIGAMLTGGLILVGPLLLYGLYLVRNERVRGDWRTS